MALLTYNQIRKKAGEAWALIYNPVYSQKNGKFLKGELKDYNINKDVLIDEVAHDNTPNLHFTILWLGPHPDVKFLLNYF